MSEEQLSNLEQQWRNYYLEYASYVVKDRAIPDVDDGLKPVQRRILHCMHESDDGRFNKVAGVVGDTMHYHPHGDASIASALVVLANKGYFIDRQGNFGNLLTGDPSAAPRYIECRLTPLAKETLYNDALTEYVESYDGRNREPVVLPAKLPVLLMMGTEGIAVGMTTMVFSHNFNELIDAEIAILENKEFHIYPDFQQGGIIDVKDYNDGNGSIKIRAKIEKDGDRKVIIREIPACTSTESLIESIEKASKSGKIKIQSINDFTSSEVNIEIIPQRGVHSDELIKQLYAYTDCETSMKGILRVIQDGYPCVMTISDVLRRNVSKLVEIIEAELKQDLSILENDFHYKMLSKIFIENKIYKMLESCSTQEEMLRVILSECCKYNDLLRKSITKEDIEKIIQTPIRSISRFDSQKNKEEIDAIVNKIDLINSKLNDVPSVAIEYLKSMKSKYGSNFKRRTQIESFESINVKDVAIKDTRVFYDKDQKLIGTSVKSDKFITCTEYDKIMILKKDGKARVIPISEKEYVGEIHSFYVHENDKQYSTIYSDALGLLYIKRFSIGQYTMNRDYQVIPEGSEIRLFEENIKQKVKINLERTSRRKNTEIEIDLSDKRFIKPRESKGVKISPYKFEQIDLI